MRIIPIGLLVLLASVIVVPSAGAAQPRPWFTFGAHVTGDARVGSTLTCDAGLWTGTPTSFTYTWKRGSTVLGTGTQYTPIAGDEIDYVGGQSNDILCLVTATNASGSYPSSDGVMVRPGVDAPVPRSIPVLSGSFAAGAVLTCQAPIYRNAPTGVTYEFESPSGGQPASTTDTYTVVAEDLGGEVACVVRASSSAGGVASRSDTIPATPAADVGGGSALLPSAPATLVGAGAVGQVMTCDPGQWPAGATITYTWTVDYDPVASTTDAYTPVPADQGEELTCRVRGERDGSVGYSYASVDAVVAGSGVETNSVAPTISGTPSVGSTLTCTPGTWTGPASGYQYAWVRDIDDPPTMGGISATLSLSGGAAIDYFGHAMRCAVRKSNASGASDWVYSSSVNVAAPAGTPVATVAPSISGTPANGSTLTCNPGTWTGAIKFGYRWTSTSPVGTPGNSSTFDLKRLPAGTRIRCLVAATSGERAFTAASPYVTVSAPAGAPGASAGPVITGSGVVGEPLTCVVESDDPTATVHYGWNIPGFTNAPGTLGYDIYYPTLAQVGRRVTCDVNLQNAFGYADAYSADPGVLIIASGGSGSGGDPESPVGPLPDDTPPDDTPPDHTPPIAAPPVETTPRSQTPTGTTPTPPKPSIITPTSRAERIQGTTRGDIIDALGGNDWIHGGAGNDRIKGGAGNDTVIGGAGRDVLDGGGGNDVIDAASDRTAGDKVICGPGRDKVIANPRDLVGKDCERVTRRR